MRHALGLLLLPALLISGCATPNTAIPTETGVYAVAAAQGISKDALLDELVAADIVLLGEQHDNPHHHRLQAWVIEQLAEHGRAPAIIVEMLDQDQQARIDQARSEAPTNVDRLASAVAWEDSGWPAWTMYRPIFAAAYLHGLPLVAGNLPRAEARAIAMQGENAISSERRKALGMNRSLDAAERARLAEIIRRSHCDLLPDRHVEGMVLAQQARDGALARAAIDAANEHRRPIVVITGNGHARTDLGIPRVIQTLAPELSTVSLSFQGREGGELDTHYDYVWLTASVEEQNHCAALRERFSQSQ